MKTLNVHETKTRLSSVLAEIEKMGETFIICRNGKPVADLVPHKRKSRIKTDKFLSQVKIACELTKPLTEEDWDI